MEHEAPRSWRQHPLLRRLPVLLVLALGLWLWRDSRTSERELVWRLEGPGWSDVRALDFQVKTTAGEWVKRETRTFSHGPPGTLSLKAELPPGAYDVWIFVRGERGDSRPLPVVPLVLGEEDVLVERALRAPANR